MSWGLRAKRIQKGATSRIAGNGWIRMWFGGADHASSRWLFIQGCASEQSPDMQAYHPCWAGIVAFSICRKLGSKCIFRFTLLQSTLSHYRKLKPAFQHVWKCTPVILRQWRSFMSTISDAQFKLTNSFHPKLTVCTTLVKRLGQVHTRTMVESPFHVSHRPTITPSHPSPSKYQVESKTFFCSASGLGFFCKWLGCAPTPESWAHMLHLASALQKFHAGLKSDVLQFKDSWTLAASKCEKALHYYRDLILAS